MSRDRSAYLTVKKRRDRIVEDVEVEAEAATDRMRGRHQLAPAAAPPPRRSSLSRKISLAFAGERGLRLTADEVVGLRAVMIVCIEGYVEFDRVIREEARQRMEARRMKDAHKPWSERVGNRRRRGVGGEKRGKKRRELYADE